MSENKGVNIKTDDKAAADTAPTPQNTPIFTAPMAAAAAAVEAGDIEASLAGNPALLSMLQGRLGSLIGASSGYVESLPKAVRERVDVLKYLQQQHLEIDKKLHMEIYELEKKYSQLYAPLYARRTALVQGDAEPTDEERAEGAKIAEEEKDDDEEQASGIEEEEDEDDEDVAGIPEFWLTALKNNPDFAELITERDEEALKFLRDIRLAYLDESPGFKLEFVFSENPFFTNAVLTKTYVYDQDDVAGALEFSHAQGSEVDWKPEQDLSVTVETKKQRHKTTNRTRVVKKTVPAQTFFSFFTTVEEPESEDESELAEETRDRISLDYELANDLKEKIVPNAIDWFTGKALEYEGLDEDEDFEDEFMDNYYEDDDDEEDSDDDEDEDSGDELSKSAKDAAEPPQCKNQ
ncbi:histone chaperone [Coemansia sp. RSA 2399]|nr:histone chaperone [Coemansia sp. RSA 2399]